jgi:hypothetical protein
MEKTSQQCRLPYDYSGPGGSRCPALFFHQWNRLKTMYKVSGQANLNATSIYITSAAAMRWELQTSAM